MTKKEYQCKAIQAIVDSHKVTPGHYKCTHRFSKRKVEEYYSLMEKVRNDSSAREEFNHYCDKLQDNIFKGEDGKYGLMSLTGEVLIPAIFDRIPEVNYDYRIETLDNYPQSRCNIVVLNNKYGLYLKHSYRTLESRFVLECIYDKIYRVYDHSSEYYVFVKNKKLGIFHGQHVCKTLFIDELDDIFFCPATYNGALICCKGNKIGLCYRGVCTRLVYDDIQLNGLVPLKVKLNNKWYWIDKNGNPTTDKHEAEFKEISFFP